jgi:hypothetical protein
MGVWLAAARIVFRAWPDLRRYDAMLSDLFNQIYNVLYGQVVSIPLDNALATLYVFLDNFVRILLSVMGFSGSGGGIFGNIRF